MRLSLPKEVEYIINTLKNNGHKAYVVGGCVRDSILGKMPSDWDLTTSAIPEEVVRVFTLEGINVIPTGIKHGTVTIIIKDNKYEITTFRTDGEYLDNRKPEYVEFTNDVVKDLGRRDFTINAMAYSLQEGLIDPFKGQCDIENKIIKSVYDPTERFREDALRILRGIRFSSQLSFQIEKDTFVAMRNHKNLVDSLSKERIRDELVKLLLSSNPSIGLELINNNNFWKHIIPSIEKIDIKIIKTIDIAPKNIKTRLTLLLMFLSVDDCQNSLKVLRFDNNTIKDVAVLVENYKLMDNVKNSKDLKLLINRVGVTNIDSILFIAKTYFELDDDEAKIAHIYNLNKQVREILKNKEPLTLKELKINGKNLESVGISHGKEMGKILNALLEHVLEFPKDNESCKLLELANKMR